jgi:hypothetical protein
VTVKVTSTAGYVGGIGPKQRQSHVEDVFVSKDNGAWRSSATGGARGLVNGSVDASGGDRYDEGVGST